MRVLAWIISCSVLLVPCAEGITPFGDDPTSISGGGSGGQAGQGGQPQCSASEELCEGQCADLQTDPDHCGSCGNACYEDQTCYNGQCRCPANAVDCGEACADLSSDPEHCGVCDNPCDAPTNAEPICEHSVCGWACADGYGDCNDQESDGCEEDTDTNVDFCGDCETVCPDVAHAPRDCTNGVCGMGACEIDFDDCDGDPATGCEADLLSSWDHCGQCNDPCAADEFCIGGLCDTTTLDCLEVAQSNPNAPDGLYQIDPDGPGGNGRVEVYCDISAGGHTVYGLTHDWGEWGTNMTIVMRNRLAPAVGSESDWDASCAIFGTTKYVGGWQNTGQTYSLAQYQVYADAGTYWTNHATQVFPTVTYNDILILQDSLSHDCWAHYAEAGSLECFGSPGGSGYAFCRQGATASKPYHIYLCL